MTAPLDLAELRSRVTKGDIDTVLVVFPNLHGRLVGKRVVGTYFLEDVLGHEGMHDCNYLLANDLDQQPFPGYRNYSWERGYGDFSAVPDLGTLRLVPWLESTALVLCDVQTETG